MSFADPMREAIAATLGTFFEGGESEMNAWLGDERKYSKHIPGLGVTLRHALQTLGTEWGRDCIDHDVWVMIAKERSRKHRQSYTTIIDDVRFLNEYAMLRKEGGVLVRVNRPNAPEKGNGHPSEHLLDDLEFDYTITNDGTVEQLKTKVWDMFHDHFGGGL